VEIHAAAKVSRRKKTSCPKAQHLPPPAAQARWPLDSQRVIGDAIAHSIEVKHVEDVVARVQVREIF